jgi:molecular chaperone DnaJ
MGGGQHDYSSAFRDFEDIFGDFSGIFDSFFGGTGRRAQRGNGGVQQGANLRYDIEIPFQDAVFGTKVEIQYSRSESCAACRGSGAAGGSGRKVCPTCAGSGQVRRSQGFFSIASPCPNCGGEGFVIEHPCKECNGTGTQKKRQKIAVTYRPASRRETRGHPQPGRRGTQRRSERGPVRLHRVKAHEHFERDGLDLYCAVPISMTQAALGAELFVTTLDGKRIKVKIPAGMQNGKMLRIRDEGVPAGGRRGDLYIKVRSRSRRNCPSAARNCSRNFPRRRASRSPKPIPLAEMSRN